MNEIIQALYAITATLPNKMAGEKHGTISLIMKYNMYAIFAMVTQWEHPDNPDSVLTIATNATVSSHQQDNYIHGKARIIFENAAIMDKALKQQMI